MTIEPWTGNFSELSVKCSSFLKEKGFSGITSRSLRNYFDKGCISAGKRSGRTIYYNQDHLIQVLMVKHFLSQGFTLKQISTHLLNHTDKELKELFIDTFIRSKKAMDPDELNLEKFKVKIPNTTPKDLAEYEPVKGLKIQFDRSIFDRTTIRSILNIMIAGLSIEK